MLDEVMAGEPGCAAGCGGAGPSATAFANAAVLSAHATPCFAAPEEAGAGERVRLPSRDVEAAGRSGVSKAVRSSARPRLAGAALVAMTDPRLELRITDRAELEPGEPAGLRVAAFAGSAGMSIGGEADRAGATSEGTGAEDVEGGALATELGRPYDDNGKYASHPDVERVRSVFATAAGG